MALVAILCTLLNYSSARDYYSSVRDYIDWLWFGKFLLIHSLPVFVGVVCCFVWQNTFLQDGSFAMSSSRRQRLVLSSTFVFVVASVISTAFFNYRFLFRVIWRRFDMSEFHFCVWYTVGFVFVFSILLYRTLPRPSVKRKSEPWRGLRDSNKIPPTCPSDCYAFWLQAEGARTIILGGRQVFLSFFRTRSVSFFRNPRRERGKSGRRVIVFAQ